ncbi:MAG: hypothetical protein ABL933_16590 [Methyloglobulus sp.]|nr:hypothetical protein [Methyloglobulus sp.]
MSAFQALCFAFLLLCVPVISISAEQLRHAPLSGQPPSIWLTQAKQTPNAIRLETHQATLAQILQTIASKTGVRIHHSTLPTQPITTICVAESVKILVECLLGSQVDLAARLSNKTAKAIAAKHSHQLTELWLLPTNSPIKTTSASDTAIGTTTPTPEQTNISDQNRIRLQATLKDAGAKDAQQRASAIYNLGLSGTKDDPEVKESLRLALRDEDANVRAQAAAAITQRGEEDLLDELAHAKLNRLDDADNIPNTETIRHIAALQQTGTLDEATAVKLLSNQADALVGNETE